MNRGTRRIALLAAALALGLTACGGPEQNARGRRGVPGPRRPHAPARRRLVRGGCGGGSSSESDSRAEEGKGDPQNVPGVEVDARAGMFPLPAAQPVTCPDGGNSVSNAAELIEVLAGAGPGDVIRLADGRYEGTFVASTSGTPDAPIWLCGSRDAVLDAGGIRGGYVLHLDGATHWRLVGFSVSNGQKGVMADGTVGSVIQDLSVSGIGDEAVHLRRHSTDNLVIGNEISDTGNRRDKFGEGVYIGTAVSNWCTITDCLPDRSDRNVIAQNTIRDTTSEAVDIKEGTTGGLLVGNTFDGSGTTAADSWVDVKGTAWTIRGNRGTNTPLDGFQTHQIEDRWGERNLFEQNRTTSGATADKDGDPGYAIALRPAGDNVVACDNVVTGGIRPANVDCR